MEADFFLLWLSLGILTDVLGTGGGAGPGGGSFTVSSFDDAFANVWGLGEGTEGFELLGIEGKELIHSVA